VKTETQIEISGHSHMSRAARTTVLQNAYERADCLTVVKCALEAIVGGRMEDHKRTQFLQMALARTDDLIGQLKQDMAALDDPLEA
jgi:signal transduction histidine kinase